MTAFYRRASYICCSVLRRLVHRLRSFYRHMLKQPPSNGPPKVPVGASGISCFPQLRCSQGVHCHACLASKSARKADELSATHSARDPVRYLVSNEHNLIANCYHNTCGRYSGRGRHNTKLTKRTDAGCRCSIARSEDEQLKRPKAMAWSRDELHAAFTRRAAGCHQASASSMVCCAPTRHCSLCCCASKSVLQRCSRCSIRRCGIHNDIWRRCSDNFQGIQACLSAQSL